MDAMTRIEKSLVEAISRAESRAGPPRLAAAVRHAVFPQGIPEYAQGYASRVAEACGARDISVIDGAAAAIELLHCASLVHDDLPCFDDSPMRRGRPSVHAAFGEPLAVLAGDALIVLAFETIAREAACVPIVLPGLLLSIARAVGMPFGIAAGQAWGMRAQDRSGPISSCEDGRIVCCRRRCRRHRRRQGCRHVARFWRMSGPGLIRLPTIFAMPPDRPKTWASPSTRTPPLDGLTRCRGWGSPEPLTGWKSLLPTLSMPSRPAQARTTCAA